MLTRILPFLFVLFLFIACDDKDENNDPPPATSGSVSGEVNLYDEGVTQIDNSGMTIRTEENDEIKTTTDDEGAFSLDDLPFGTYTIIYEKDGYGTFKNFDVEHNSTSTVITENPSLGQISSTQVTNLEVSQGFGEVTFTVTTAPPSNNGNPRYIRIFFSDSPDVSNESFDAETEGLIIQINPVNLQFGPADFADLGLTSGTTAYAKVYGDSFWSNSYEDPNLGRTVYPNLNSISATAVEFFVP